MDKLKSGPASLKEKKGILTSMYRSLGKKPRNGASGEDAAMNLIVDKYRYLNPKKALTRDEALAELRGKSPPSVVETPGQDDEQPSIETPPAETAKPVEPEAPSKAHETTLTSKMLNQVIDSERDAVDKKRILDRWLESLKDGRFVCNNDALWSEIIRQRNSIRDKLDRKHRVKVGGIWEGISYNALMAEVEAMSKLPEGKRSGKKDRLALLYNMLESEQEGGSPWEEGLNKRLKFEIARTYHDLFDSESILDHAEQMIIDSIE